MQVFFFLVQKNVQKQVYKSLAVQLWTGDVMKDRLQTPQTVDAHGDQALDRAKASFLVENRVEEGWWNHLECGDKHP